MKFVILGLWFQILSLFNSFLLYAWGNNFNTGFCNSLELLLCLHSPKQVIQVCCLISKDTVFKTSNSKYVDSQARWLCSHNISRINGIRKLSGSSNFQRVCRVTRGSTWPPNMIHMLHIVCPRAHPSLLSAVQCRLTLRLWASPNSMVWPD